MTIDLASPDWFLFGIDTDSETLRFLRTGENAIRSASFLDGRETISNTGEVQGLPLRRTVGKNTSTPTCDRFVAHTAFCGSTFLAKLLDVPAKTLCYREPQVLVDLARMKVEQHPIVQDGTLWDDLVRFCLAQLNKHWGETSTVVKPSNWANIILADVARVSPDFSLVSLTSDDEHFLTANLSGGQERIRYSLNLLNALIKVDLVSQRDVQAAESSDIPGLENILRLLLVLHRAQKVLLQQPARDGRPVYNCSYDELSTAPLKTAHACAAHLDLPLSDEDLHASHQRESAFHSKDRSNQYDADREQQKRTELLEQFGSEIAGALAWSRSVSRPQS